MTIVNKLVSYSEKDNKMLDEMDDALKVIVRDMEKWILTSIKNTISFDNGKYAEDNMLDIVEQIYSSEYWEDVQERVYDKSSSLLSKFRKKFKSGIDDLKSLYPESKFQMSSLSYIWEEYERYIKEDLDVLKLMNVSQSDVLGIARMNQVSLITNLDDNIISTIESSLGAPISHLQTRLTTSTNVINNDIRHRFFKSITTKRPKRYVYAGVSDGKTRPFCRENLGKIKTERGWRATENGQVGSAWEYAGGYNCRHSTYLVSENWTDKEVKQIEDDFRFRRI